MVEGVPLALGLLELVVDEVGDRVGDVLLLGVSVVVAAQCRANIGACHVAHSWWHLHGRDAHTRGGTWLR